MKHIYRVYCYKDTSVEFERYDPTRDDWDSYHPEAYRERNYKPTRTSLARLGRVVEQMVNNGEAKISLSPPSWEIEL